MIGYPIFCYATYGCNLFCRDLWILLIIFRIVSVVSAGVSVVTEGVSVVVSVVSLMFLSCLRQVYEVYVLKKVTSILATFFSILCFLFIF